MKTSDLQITGLGKGGLDIEDLASLPGGDDGSVPVSSILEQSEVDPAAHYCSVISRDGEYSASIPLGDLEQSGVLLLDHRGRLRLKVVDGTTLCWNVKDVGEMRLTREREPDSVPERPPH